MEDLVVYNSNVAYAMEDLVVYNSYIAYHLKPTAWVDQSAAHFRYTP